MCRLVDFVESTDVFDCSKPHVDFAEHQATARHASRRIAHGLMGIKARAASLPADRPAVEQSHWLQKAFEALGAQTGVTMIRGQCWVCTSCVCAYAFSSKAKVANHSSSHAIFINEAVLLSHSSRCSWTARSKLDVFARCSDLSMSGSEPLAMQIGFDALHIRPLFVHHGGWPNGRCELLGGNVAQLSLGWSCRISPIFCHVRLTGRVHVR